MPRRESDKRMGFLQRVSSVAAPATMRADSLSQTYRNAFWAGDDLTWLASLSAAGVIVTPELAMTLTAMYDGVTLIGRDLGTLPCQLFRRLEDDDKEKVRPFFGEGIDTSGGIRSLSYMLRWQPNDVQTATEYWLCQVAQYLLRGVAYAEIIEGRGTERGRTVALLLGIPIGSFPKCSRQAGCATNCGNHAGQIGSSWTRTCTSCGI